MLFESSPWLILAGMVTGGLYAWILYQKRNPWSRRVTAILAGLRFILVFLIFLLLLGPLIRYLTRSTEKPSVVIAIDNSLSVRESTDSLHRNFFLRQLAELGDHLENNGFEVMYLDIQGRPVSDPGLIKFDHPSTNLDGLLKQVQSSREGKNMAGLVLMSDGIYNEGTSPLYSHFRYPVYSLGIGDTIEKNDLSILETRVNKVAFQGNQFPVRIDIYNKGYSGRETSLEIIHKGIIIDTRNIRFGQDRGFQTIDLFLKAGLSGTQRFSIKLSPLENELSRKNNMYDFYIDVIEGKKKILLLAHAPHPDIKAIGSAIEKNENYEYSLVFPDNGNVKPDDYDLVIYHQLPDNEGNFDSWLDRFIKEKVPSFFIIGNQTSLPKLSAHTTWMNIMARSSLNDQAFPEFNSQFPGFSILEKEREVFKNFPPVLVPFADYNTRGPAEILLYQRIGSVSTQTPLLIFSDENDCRHAVLMGEGIWRWRMNEYLEYHTHETFDGFILKLIQYLHAGKDKRRFRVLPLKKEFLDHQEVILETEAYNDIYERIFGLTVTLSVKDENGISTEYSYITSESNSRISIPGLKEGIYSYAARTRIGGELFVSEGVFAVKKLQIETINLTADFDLLRELSEKTGGRFLTSSNLNTEGLPLITGDARPVISSSEDMVPAIHLWWLFPLFLILISLEWGSRKYLGGY